jgi:hypothetical protein
MQRTGRVYASYCKKLMGIPNCEPMDLPRGNLAENVGEVKCIGREESTRTPIGYVFGHRRSGKTVL